MHLLCLPVFWWSWINTLLKNLQWTILVYDLNKLFTRVNHFLVRNIQDVLDRMQYAYVRYAERSNPVIYIKIVQLSTRNATYTFKSITISRDRAHIWNCIVNTIKTWIV